MMKILMKMIVLILSITIIVFMACAQKKVDSLSSTETTVVGNTIYCSGKPFAKIWTIDPDCYMGHQLFSTQTVSGIGLVIHYYNDGKEAWIHPKKGLSIYVDGREYDKIADMQQVWDKSLKEGRAISREGGIFIQFGGKRYPEKEDLVRSVVFDVRISNDGKYVYYKSQGMLWNSSHKYLVEVKN